MSKNIWQIRKQNEKLIYGKSITSKINAYIKTWEDRCYSNGIPDDAPDKLLFSGSVPSYKAIAICILNNDLKFKKLGFYEKYSEKQIELINQLKESSQINLI